MTRPYDGAVEAEVVGRRAVARDVLEVELRPVDGGPWPDHDAGAHVDVWLPNGLVRQYSLVAPARAAATCRIAVLKAADSRGGSVYVHERLLTGHRLLVSEPKNTFELADAGPGPVLIAGGIGVTPLLAMARTLAARGRPFAFHYQVRTPDRAAYAAELRGLVPEGALHVRADFDDGFFPAAEVLRAAGPETSVYVCGPEAFMEFVRKEGEAAGVAAEAFHVEHFKHDADTAGHPFTLTAVRSGATVEVGAADTPSRALARAGVFVPTACEQGVCGTCVVRVLGGSPDHRDVVLSAAEKASGQVMALCCSRASGQSIAVDL
ncbi:PDR/VanB family oxidoreductase [Streptomyces sp. NPDC047002]|uniref:PDR/VanB family oxidoreductase n=1 Tax=Streptomyces sp. NPDC047002 TaxID=3155475 RepID=UPI003454F60A